MTKKKKKIYELIMKTANILELLTLLFIVIIAIINYIWKIDDEIFMRIMLFSLGAFVLFAAVFIPMFFYYLNHFDNSSENIAPFVYNTNIKDYNRFQNIFEKKLKRRKYKIDEVEIQGKIISYAIKNKLLETDIFIFLHVTELEESLFADDNNLFEEIIRYLYKKKAILKSIKNCRYIVGIDKENVLFKKVAKDTVFPEVKFNKLQVVISLESMKLYINKQVSDVAKGPYNKMKKEFLEFIKSNIKK